MLRFVAARIVLLIPVLLGAAAIVFILIHAAPGDPTSVLLGQNASEATRAALRERLGLDEPLPVQFFRWLALALQGDFGTSISLRRPVLEIVASQFRNTLLLAFASGALGLAVGIPLGIVSAVKRNSSFDKGVLGISLFGLSMPPFWLSLVLIYVFAIQLRIFPTGQMSSSADAGFLDTLWHLVLPAIAASIAVTGIIIRVTRAAMLEVLSLDFLLALRAKGVPERAVIYGHALRNALPTVVTMSGLQLGYLLLGSTLFVEIVFGWPGIGLLTYNAVFTHDLPLAAGIVLLSTVLFVLLNLVVDVVAAVVSRRALV
jgi:ABC-type dipeptide/oligopeptide/nickel transport system permease component